MGVPVVQKKTGLRSSLIKSALLGLVLGVAASLLVLIIPVRMLESMTRLTGLAKLMVQAEPPISPTDRSLLAVLTGIVTAGVGWVLIDWLLFGRAAMRTLFRTREDEFEDADADNFEAADPIDPMASVSLPHIGRTAQPDFDPRPPLLDPASPGPTMPLQPGVPPPLVPAPPVMPRDPVPETSGAQLSSDPPSPRVSGSPEPTPPGAARLISEPDPPAQPERPAAPQPRPAPVPGTPLVQAPATASPVAGGPAIKKPELEELLARFERAVQSRRAAAAHGLPAPTAPLGVMPSKTVAASPEARGTVPPAPEPVSAAPTRAIENSSDKLLDQPLHVTLEMLRNMVKR